MNIGISELIIIYIIWNIIVFLLMALDKFKAKHEMWRIKESTLLLACFAFGGVGGLVGARVFRHKTQKMRFKILIPVSIIFNFFAIVGVYVIWVGGN